VIEVAGGTVGGNAAKGKNCACSKKKSRQMAIISQNRNGLGTQRNLLEPAPSQGGKASLKKYGVLIKMVKLKEGNVGHVTGAKPNREKKNSR